VFDAVFHSKSPLLPEAARLPSTRPNH
jgi:hypothetical protein